MLANATVSHAEESRLCADTLTVWLIIEDDNTIADFTFDGHISAVSTGYASLVGESVVGMRAEEVLTLDYWYVRDLLDMEVSTKRKQASTLGLLAIRNAVHKYLKDGKTDDFSDVLPD